MQNDPHNVHDAGVVARAEATVFKASDESEEAAKELRKIAKARGIVFAPNVSVERMKRRLAEA